MRVVEKVHHALAETLRPGDIAIDATAGNGHDVVMLAQLVGASGKVHAFADPDSTSGYAVPHFIVDTPDGGGKFSLVPDHIDGRDGDDLLINLFKYLSTPQTPQREIY